MVKLSPQKILPLKAKELQLDPNNKEDLLKAHLINNLDQNERKVIVCMGFLHLNNNNFKNNYFSIICSSSTNLLNHNINLISILHI
jgi:hypothetical protein